GALALVARSTVGVALGVLLAVWIGLATLWQVVLRLRSGAPEPGRWWRRGRAVPAAFWGMVVAHAGVAVFVLGVTLVKGLDHEQDSVLAVGGRVQVAGYDFHLQTLPRHEGPNFIAGRARFEVSHNGRRVATLHPEKRFYVVQRMPMTEAAIDRGF